MKKEIILTLMAVFFMVVFLSGCISNVTRDFETCVCIVIIFPILFIILIAYLLGHKKTKIETIIHQPPPAYPTVRYLEKNESTSKKEDARNVEES